MSRADIVTLLPLDRYAEIMGIHPDAFNQCVNPAFTYAGCERTWVQHGWMDSNTMIGRHDVAQAIAEAEEMIAQVCGFWPSPTWVGGSDEEQRWPLPKRGVQAFFPPIELNWGWILAGGREDVDTPIAAGKAVIYTDRDGDGVRETATIVVTAAELALVVGATWNEVAVYYPAEYLDWSPYPRNEQWRIRPLKISVSPVTGDIELTGRRSQFVRPELWNAGADIDLSVDANFLTYVDVYRRWNNPEESAQLVYSASSDLCSVTEACVETCQSACVIIQERRQSTVRTMPASYSAGSWTEAVFTGGQTPDKIRVWYQAGFHRNISGWMEGDFMNRAIAEAIVRLANTRLLSNPCGCDQARWRWESDREEQDINTIDAALAMSAFGCVTRGSIYAWGVVKRMNPLAGAGAI